MRAASATRPVPPEPDILATLGRRARGLRLARQLTLRALAEASGVSLRFLMDVEAGRGNISVKRLADLAAALRTTPAELVTDDASAAPVIALLGLRGAGKTTIGKALARKLRVPFVELDREIEQRAGLALGEIFSLHGEDYYRRLEHDTLADLLATPRPMVLAAGGGLVTSAASYALLRRSATTVWLKAKPEDYWTRVSRQGDRRPMDQHPQAREALRTLVTRRDALYAQADVTLDTSGLTVAKAVERLARLSRPA
jgi:XRE family transcriptional regulator, aerobic/anaerobic benzoate catabolism transcriptional regulator